MRTIAVGLMLVLAARPLVGQESVVSRLDLFVIGNVVASVRLVVLRDSTRVSYCAIDAFWDSSGSLLLKDAAADLSRYPHRSRCPGGPEAQDGIDYRNVNLSHLKVYADSIVLLGSTRRGATFFWERYKLKREQGVIREPEYSVFAIGHDNTGR